MKILVLLISIFPLTADAWWFGNYDDCILENIKPGMSNAAVRIVKDACRGKYPLPQPKKSNKIPPAINSSDYCIDFREELNDNLSCEYVSLSNEEIANVKLQPDSYGNSIWNGNAFAVRQLIFNLKYKKADYPYGQSSSNEVNITAGCVEAESTKSNSVLDFPDGIYSYQIIKATKKICK